jgi:hypothetical protein
MNNEHLEEEDVERFIPLEDDIEPEKFQEYYENYLDELEEDNG